MSNTKPRSKVPGGLSQETGGLHQAGRSSNAGSTNANAQSTLVMSDTTPQTNPVVDFQATQQYQQVDPSLAQYRLIHAFATKLGILVSWHHIDLGERSGFALFFDDAKWKIDPATKELTPVGSKENDK